ncbi:hypothetical protein HU200_061879 [Digitaria exilis]|uniref:BPM/SPOP BACK domain-containing protein n=1 Tax=Digitaria exilis TaxID=1010633 RepID=A0A835A9H3_9POAL|nr:hypothetical protein HU200_061879 [Digitaria exilis]
MLRFIYTDALPRDEELGDSPATEMLHDLLACFAFFAEEENLKKAQLTDDFVRLRKKFPSIIDELKEKTKP